jgi:putative CocE/NonD family hydrolase
MAAVDLLCDRGGHWHPELLLRIGRRAVSGLVPMVFATMLASCAHGDWRQQEPLAQHQGSVAPAYERSAYYVPARDGTFLALTVYRAPSEARHPVLLWIQPTQRETIDPRTGELFPVMRREDIAFFTAHGYAIALAEMRGGGASFGARDLDRSPQLGRDGADLVNWIAQQPWSDGTTGMIGSSYQGFIQYATAAERPAGLRAIFPEIAGFDDYSSMFHPGGIANTALASFAAGSMAALAQNAFNAERNLLPSAPVVDEDGDGSLVDEIPLDLDGDGSFADEQEPTYADGEARQDIYWRATRDHLANNDISVAELEAAPHRDSRLAGTPYTYADIDPANRPALIADSGIAVYNRGGWFDYHARDAALWFATLDGHTPTRMMMAPTGHGGFPLAEGDALYAAGPYFALFDDPTTNAVLNEEKLRFFDRYVRGIDNGFDDAPPVRIYVMGEGWRSEAGWPLARAVATRMHFGADGSLQDQPGEPGYDSYRVNFAATSLSDGANRWNYGISRSTRPLSLDADAHRRQAYASDILARDTEVTGHPVLELVLSSNMPEGDVFAYLEDVAPDGTSLLVSEGQLRANYARLRPISGMVSSGHRPLTVLPDLPWQGFDAADYVARPFADGAEVRVKFDLMPVSWIFRAGHRIRMSLAGADAGSFAVHPGLQAAVAAGDAPIWRIRRGAGQSMLILPVIPKQEQ